MDATSQRWLLDRLLVTLFVSTQPATLHRRGCAAHFIGQFEASWIYTGAFGIKPIEGVKVVCLKNLHSANFNWLEFVSLACLRHVGYFDSQSKREAG